MKFKFVVVLFAGLFTLTLFGCKQEAKQVLSEKTIQQLKRLPADAPVYGYANLQRLRQADLSKTLIDSIQKRLAHSAAMSRFRAQTGLNPQEDVQEVFFAGVLPDGREEPKGLLVALGKFKSDKIMAFIESKDKEKKLTEEIFLKHTLLVSEEKSFALCIVDSTTLLVGQVQQVKGWLTHKDNRQVSTQTALLKKVEKIKYPQGMWICMNMDPVKEKLRQKDLKKLNILKKLNDFTLSVDVTNQIRFFATGTFSDTEQAGLFRDAIKGVIAAGKLSVSDKRDLIDILNSIEVDTDGNQISVDFRLTKKDFQKLLDQKKKLRKKMSAV